VWLELMDRRVDLVAEGFDIDIRVGEVEEAGLIPHHIASTPRILCATPGYLDTHGHPRTPQDLTQHDCMVFRDRDEPFGTWKLKGPQRWETVTVTGSLASNDSEVALRWCLEGRGIVMMADWNVDQELADGRLLFTAWLEGEGEALWVPGFAMVNADLSLDTSFGDQGFTVVPFDELRKARGARAAQVGAVMGTAAHFVIPFVVNDEQTFVIRLLANGKLDTGYHGRGYQEIVYEGSACELPAATTLEDGRMLLAGRLTAGSQTLIVALTAQGEIDASFGQEGVALVDLPEARLLSIFQSPEHRLQVSGFLGNQGLLASLKPDGALDTQFNQGAPLYLRPDAARLRVERLETGLDGLICGVGQDHALNLVESKGVLTCHGLDGAPHPAFGPQGTLFVDNSFGFWDLKLQRDGKWLVTGSHSPSRAGLVCRYHFS